MAHAGKQLGSIHVGESDIFTGPVQRRIGTFQVADIDHHTAIRLLWRGIENSRYCAEYAQVTNFCFPDPVHSANSKIQRVKLFWQYTATWLFKVWFQMVQILWMNKFAEVFKAGIGLYVFTQQLFKSSKELQLPIYRLKLPCHDTAGFNTLTQNFVVNTQSLLCLSLVGDINKTPFTIFTTIFVKNPAI